MRRFSKIHFVLLTLTLFLWGNRAQADLDIDFKSLMNCKWAEPFATDATDYALSDLMDGDKLLYGNIDFKILGKGRGSSLDLSFLRRYNSTFNVNGVCGPSWFSNLDISLQVVGMQVAFRDEIGDTFIYSFFFGWPYGYYWGPLSKPNPHWYYQSGSTSIIQKKYGNKYIFDTATKFLLKIQDRNGNEIVYNRNASNQVTSIQDSSGRQIIFTYNAQGKLATATDPLSRTYAYGYDANQNLISVTDPLNGTTSLEYQSPLDIHNVTRITKPEGNYQDFEYNADDKLTRILQNGSEVWNMIHNQALASMISTNAVGLQATRQFLESGKKITITDNFGTETNELDDWGYLKKYTDRLGRVTTMSRDSRGNVLSMTNARGNVTTQSFYYAWNRPSQMFSPLSITETFIYDSKGNLIQYANPEGGVCAFTYDAAGLPLTFKDANYKTTSFEYDAYGNIKKITGPTGGIREYTYDLAGNILTFKDANNNTTSYQYDSLNHRTQITYPDTSTRIFSYDANGNLLSSTDENGNNSTLTYNFWDKEATITDPEGNTFNCAYDAVGRKISYTDPKNFVTQYQYDVRDRLTRITYPDNTFTSLEYAAQSLSKMSDASGQRPIRVSDPMGNLHQIEYNELYARTKNIDPLGNQRLRIWDAKDRLIEEKDENNNSTKYTYDKWDQVTSIENALTFKKIITYDYGGNITSIKDEENHLTSYQYDGLNRITTKVNALNKTTGYAFDQNSNLLSITDPLSHPISWQYDSKNRKIKEIDLQNHQIQYNYDGKGNVTQVTRPDGSQVALEYFRNNLLKKITYPGNQMISFAYDSNKNLTSMTDWNGVTTFSYSNRNFLTEIVRPDGKKIQYAYNANGARTLLKLLSSTGTELYRITHTLDALSRVTQIQDGIGNFVSFTYDPAGRRSTKTFSNGVVTSYLYDVANRLAQQKCVNTSQVVLSQLDFTRDKTGNILTEIAESGLVKTYGYDAIYQLLSVNYNNGQSTAWTYDGAGNRLAQNENGVQRSYTYNNLNQLLSTLESGVTTSFTYDLNGNLTQESNASQTTQYVYNFLNKLASITKTGTQNDTLTMSYDGLGRRLSKTYTSGGNISYLYDGQNILEEISGSNSTYYMAGSIDEIFATTSGTQTEFYLTDRLNSLRKVVDLNQNVTTSLDYKPFGSLLSGTPGTNHYLFTGRERDFGDTYYYRARTYSPITGRFQQQDPIGTFGGINFYSYAHNSPIFLVDPLGLDSVTVYADQSTGSSMGGSTGGEFGHGWVEVSKDDGSTLNAGNYPDGVGDDTSYNDNANASYEFDVTSDEADQAIAVIQEQQDNPTYEPYSDNCVDFVEEVLDAANIEHPDFDTLWISDPNKLAEWLKEKAQEALNK